MAREQSTSQQGQRDTAVSNAVRSERDSGSKCALLGNQPTAGQARAVAGWVRDGQGREASWERREGDRHSPHPHRGWGGTGARTCLNLVEHLLEAGVFHCERILPPEEE